MCGTPLPCNRELHCDLLGAASRCCLSRCLLLSSHWNPQSELIHLSPSAPPYQATAEPVRQYCSSASFFGGCNTRRTDEFGSASLCSLDWRDCVACVVESYLELLTDGRRKSSEILEDTSGPHQLIGRHVGIVRNAERMDMVLNLCYKSEDNSVAVQYC